MSRKKRVRRPGFWAMVGRGLRTFKAFLGSSLYYCPHDWGRFCPKCRLWIARRALNKAGLQWIVVARNGESVQPFMERLERAMRIEDVELFRVLEDGLETEADDTPEEPTGSEEVPPQPRPETRACPVCDTPIQGGICHVCGHYEADEVPYEPPREIDSPTEPESED